MPIKVAIIENEKTFAEALQLILNNSGGAFACGQVFFSGEAALSKLAQNPPDVLLVDLDLGEGCMSGIEFIAKCKSLIPSALPMVLTVFEDHQKVFQALSAGALGYVLKTSGEEKILAAIGDLTDGGAPMSPSIARKVAESFSQGVVSKTPENGLLSSREKEVIELISRGKLEKEVAAELFISLKTVKAHISNIYRKLEVHTRVEALNKYFGR